MSSKKHLTAKKLVEEGKTYNLETAVDLLKKAVHTKFDETVELHMVLGIDPKQSDQMVRGIISLPNGIGKSKKVAVVTKGEKLKEAEESGADFVGAEDLIEKISKGWLEFESLVATPDMMKDLSKLGKILGPKGLMPNPKAGTVTFDIAKTIKEIKAGRIEYKVDGYGIIHVPVGKISFSADKLVENIKVLIDVVTRARPASAKGQYIKGITVTSTMGPGIPLDLRQKFV